MKASVALGELPYAAVMPWPTTLLRFHANHFCAHLNRVTNSLLAFWNWKCTQQFCDSRFGTVGECAKVSRYFAPERG